MATIIETPYDRQFRVGKNYLELAELDGDRRVFGASLTTDITLEIGIALIESTGRTVGELAKEQAEKAEREKAEKLQARQEELAKKFSKWRYIELHSATRSAIDYIIELEDAAKP